MVRRDGLLRSSPVWLAVSAILAFTLPGSAGAWPERKELEPDEGWPVRGLRDVATVFPQSQLISSPGGSEYLDEAVSDVLKTIARDDRGFPSQIAFVVDRSFPDDFGQALELALAGNRDKAPLGSYALVTCGHDNGIWSARIEVPLTPDVYTVLRRSAHLKWTGNSTAIAATWMGIAAAATELSWKPASANPHVVVLTDDRPHPELIGNLPKNAPLTDTTARPRIRTWAQTWHATLHVIRVSPKPPREPRYEGQLDPRMELPTVAGLFREQRYVKASSAAALMREIDQALAVAGSIDGPSDLAIVDNQGDALDGPRGALLHAVPAFERFCMAAGHRVALVRWGNGAKPRVVFDFTSDSAKVIRAVTSAASRPHPAARDPLFDALDKARHLAWAPKAHKAALVFSDPYLEAGKISLDSILDWADTNDVTVTLVGP